MHQRRFDRGVSGESSDRPRPIHDSSSDHTISKGSGLRWADGDFLLSPDPQAAIENNNRTGLKLHAVIETAPKEKLLQIAQELDDQRRAGVSHGPYPAQTLRALECHIAKLHHVVPWNW